MKILLVSPPSETVALTREEMRYWGWHYRLKLLTTFASVLPKNRVFFGNFENQNIGLLALASALNPKHSVLYLAPDVTIKHKGHFAEKLVEQLRAERPEVVGFSAHTASIPTVMDLAQTVKHILPKAVTVLGGPHANGSDGRTMDELLLKFDYVIRGRGELPLQVLLDNLGRPDVRHPGIFYKNGPPSGINLENAQLGTLPNQLLVSPIPAARVYSSLGCKRGCLPCAFCGDVLHNASYVERDINAVINEMKFFINEKGTRYFYFGDENFLLDSRRAMNLVDALVDLNKWCRESMDPSGFFIGIQGNITSARQTVIDNISQSGLCTEIQYGVESSCDAVLKLCRKGLPYRMVEPACRYTRSVGVSAHCYFISGLPGETPETSQRNVDEMVRLLSGDSKSRAVDFIEYRCFVPFPGTPVWKNPAAFGIEITNFNWGDWLSQHYPVFRLEGMEPYEIYRFYLQGLDRIADVYEARFKSEYPGIDPESIDISFLDQSGVF